MVSIAMTSSKGALTVVFEGDERPETLVYTGETIIVTPCDFNAALSNTTFKKQSSKCQLRYHPITYTGMKVLSGTPNTFAATNVSEPLVEKGITISIQGRLQVITNMDIYSHKSIESSFIRRSQQRQELRLEDYMNANLGNGKVVLAYTPSTPDSGTPALQYSSTPDSSTTILPASSSVRSFKMAKRTKKRGKARLKSSVYSKSSSNKTSTTDSSTKLFEALPSTTAHAIFTPTVNSEPIPDAPLSITSFSFKPNISFISESDPVHVFTAPQPPAAVNEPLSSLSVSEGQQLRDALLESIVKCMQIQNSLYRLVLLKLQACVTGQTDAESQLSEALNSSKAIGTGDAKENVTNLTKSVPEASFTENEVGNEDDARNKEDTVESLNDTPGTTSVESTKIYLAETPKATNKESVGEGKSLSNTPMALLCELKEPLNALKRCADIQRSLFQSLINMNVMTTEEASDSSVKRSSLSENQADLLEHCNDLYKNAVRKLKLPDKMFMLPSQRISFSSHLGLYNSGMQTLTTLLSRSQSKSSQSFKLLINRINVLTQCPGVLSLVKIVCFLLINKEIWYSQSLPGFIDKMFAIACAELYINGEVDMLTVQSKLEAVTFKTKMECNYAQNPFTSQHLKPSTSEDTLQHISLDNVPSNLERGGGASSGQELPHGRGTLKTATGEFIYSGDWHKGKRHGKGEGLILPFPVVTTEHGFYIGGWKHNMRHGHGKMMFSSGAVYEGQWQFDKMTGYGTLKLPDGTIQEGTWKEGSLQGCTLFTWPHGVTEYREYDTNRGQVSSCKLEEDSAEKQSQISCIRSQLLNVRDCVTNLKDEKLSLTEQVNRLKTEYTEMVRKLHTFVFEIHQNYVEQWDQDSQEQREEFLNKALKEAESKPAEEIAKLKQELQETKDALLCQICFVRRRDCIIFPCSHLLYCRICLAENKSKGDSRCPTCRGPISSEIMCNVNNSS